MVIRLILLALVLFNFQAAYSGDEILSGDCISGMAAGHPCQDVDLGARLDLKTSGIRAASGNDISEWTDRETGREYALMGLSSKTAFVDITDPQNPIHLGDLRTHTNNSLWRDISVYGHYAFIVSEASDHGMQIFDLHQLRDVDSSPAVEFEETAHYDQFGSAHTITINEDTATAYAVGSDTCDAGMHVVDVSDPLEPVFLTCVDRSIFTPVMTTSIQHGEDYTHETQCVIYHGPDERYKGDEVCVCSNADTVNIVNMTNKAAPVQISVTDYPGLGYTHQGWLTEDHRFFFLGDELDEINFGHNTKTLIWDMQDLENPTLMGSYEHATKSIDHNMYVKGDYLYQANYEAGLRVLDVSDIENVHEVAFFDTIPDSDQARFEGAWGVFPFYESGTVVISNINGYLFVLRPSL